VYLFDLSGQKRGHKGGRRQFTNPQLIDKQKEKEEKEREWRRKRGEVDDDSDEEGSDEDESGSEESSSSEEQSGSESSSEEEANDKDKKADPKAKDAAKTEVCNPNRMPQKAVNKRNLNDLVTGKPKVELSRREREEIEKQNRQAAYNKMHAEGKTDQARADLARLAIIRQQREEAARKRETDQKGSAVAGSSKSKK
jgi:hypothetical protein